MDFPVYGILAMTIILGINSLMIINASKHMKSELVDIEGLERLVKMDIYEPSYKYDLAEAYLDYAEEMENIMI